MAKREKVILLIMGAVVLAGIYMVFFPSPSEYSEGELGVDTQALEQAVADLEAALAKAEVSEAEAFAVEQAEAPWGQDPFYDKIYVARSGADTEGGATRPRFIYSGFLAMGGRMTAIINDMEYQAGDELEMGGYIVGAIYADRVILRVKGLDEEITVPFEEEGL